MESYTHPKRQLFRRREVRFRPAAGFREKQPRQKIVSFYFNDLLPNSWSPFRIQGVKIRQIRRLAVIDELQTASPHFSGFRSRSRPEALLGRLFNLPLVCSPGSG
jgi:hypothetical protein